ncbi:MAG TPA: nucleotidyltransferase domain-containing protein [Acidimicrobiia bacterium]|nr:nucleotidyltransferase domain-containing protein [Acidimicrobiia bacterium]
MGAATADQEQTVIRLPGTEVDESELRAVCRRYGVAELSVFGSVVKGQARSDSDIDLLYVLERDARLGLAIEHLARDLEALFGRKVDLVAKRKVHPLVRDEVLGEAQVLYAA